MENGTEIIPIPAYSQVASFQLVLGAIRKLVEALWLVIAEDGREKGFRFGPDILNIY